MINCKHYGENNHGLQAEFTVNGKHFCSVCISELFSARLKSYDLEPEEE